MTFRLNNLKKLLKVSLDWHKNEIIINLEKWLQAASIDERLPG